MHSSGILLVDDDPNALQMMERLLDGLGETRVATNGVDALRLARESTPNLVLLDAEMPGMSGFHVCEALKADRDLGDVPVIFVTSHDDPDFEFTSFKLGAVDFITKPVSPSLALARINAHLHTQRRSDDMRHLLRIDPLTDTGNRRSLNEALRREWRRAQRSGEAISLLLVAVDCFGPLREHQGASESEHCLKTIAKCLSRVCRRPSDIVTRFSENSFALLLPSTPRSGAEHIAHQVLDSVEALHMPHRASSVSNHVTISAGVGCYDSHSANWIVPSQDSRFANTRRDHRRADDLVQAAEVSLRAAQLGGGAQAWLLDIADGDKPHLAREISLTSRQLRGRTLPASSASGPSRPPFTAVGQS